MRLPVRLFKPLVLRIWGRSQGIWTPGPPYALPSHPQQRQIATGGAWVLVAAEYREGFERGEGPRLDHPELLAGDEVPDPAFLPQGPTGLRSPTHNLPSLPEPP